MEGIIARASLAESRPDGNGNLEVSSMKQSGEDRIRINRSDTGIGVFFNPLAMVKENTTVAFIQQGQSLVYNLPFLKIYFIVNQITP